MQNTAALQGQMIAALTEQYMEPLFYFCLKKTSNPAEAEDLTQEIALHILTALHRGTVPSHFSAWVWQIARNRYSVWAERKHRHCLMQTDSDIGDCEICDTDSDVSDDLIRAEELSLLRRELAFIRREYRDIVVAYYIENRCVREIASAQQLSVSAVQQRLHRARTILKEGMDMARTFGKRSYNPEDISFAASGKQPSGLPWSAVERSIPKNILLQASNNPSTAEELSMELGIALPYMEEEIELLYQATLLEKQGDRYVTNFFIMDRDCRVDIYCILRRDAEEREQLLRRFIVESEGQIRALGIAGDHLSDQAIRWWLVPALIDQLIENTVTEESIYEPPVRANGESWGFVGYEAHELPEYIVMGHNGSGNNDIMFWTYKYSIGAMWDQCGEPSYEEVMLLGSCLRDGRTAESFQDTEMPFWNNINGRYAHADKNGQIIPDILIFQKNQMEEIFRIFRNHAVYEPLAENFRRAYEAVGSIFRKYSHSVLHSHIGYYIRMELYTCRMMAVHDLIAGGLLSVPENPGISSLGMHLILG